MTYQEYDTIVKSMIADPDKAAESAVALMDEIKKDTDLIAGFGEKEASYNKTISELRNTNYNLFMRASGGAADITVSEEEEEEVDRLEAHMKELFGEG